LKKNYFKVDAMKFVAHARHIRFSPEKMRPLVDTIRGKNVSYALNWLTTCAVQRAVPIRKMIESAASNAKSLQGVETDFLIVKIINVDRAKKIRYFKPGAMGRSNPQSKQLCHMSVILESVGKED
jgi:large subunit ribosomal protein L22